MKAFLILAFAGLLLGVGAVLPAAAHGRPWKGDSILEDPEWRRSFLGSYGFLSGAEPQIRPDELELLREVLEVMRANPRAAAAMLEPQIGQDSSAALDFVIANLEFQIGDLELAASHYQNALAKFPDFRRAHKNLGLLRVQEADFGAALEHLSRALELGDRDGRNYGLLGYCHLNLESYLAAEVAYRNAILQQPGIRDWKLGLARSLLAMERYREAVALFDSLIESDPEDAASWLLQANAYIGLDKPLAAAVNLEAVRALGKSQTRSLVLLGDIYMNSGMPELAKSAYLEVIASDEGGTQFSTAYRAADLLIRTRAYDQAQEILASLDRRYGELAPDDELKVLTLRAVLARGQGREQEAARLLESVVERDGTRGDALLELARYHRSQGDRERALLLVERAGRLEAFRYPALLEQAQLMVAGRDYRRAAELLREALQIKSEPRVEQFLARVEQAVRP
jgi:tetratricopeptide (TPR) repeat protein